MIPKFFVFLTVLIFVHEAFPMSEAQLKSSVKMIRSICQPKTKVSNADIDGMHSGTFPNDQKVKCYTSCTLHALKFLKDGKINYDFAIGEARKLPDNRKKATEDSIVACKDSITSSDKCEAAYQLSQCIYKANPSNYFLP